MSNSSLQKKCVYFSRNSSRNNTIEYTTQFETDWFFSCYTVQYHHRKIQCKYRFLFVNSAKMSTLSIFQQAIYFLNLIVCKISLIEGNNSVG